VIKSAIYQGIKIWAISNKAGHTTVRKERIKSNYFDGQNDQNEFTWKAIMSCRIVEYWSFYLYLKEENFIPTVLHLNWL